MPDDSPPPPSPAAALLDRALTALDEKVEGALQGRGPHPHQDHKHQHPTASLILLLFEWLRPRLNSVATKEDLKEIHRYTKMKLEEIKKQIAESAVASTEAFGEIGTRISDLQTALEKALEDAKNLDITDPTFLADLQTIRTNVDQLAAIVPNPQDSNVSTSFAGGKQHAPQSGKQQPAGGKTSKQS